MSDALSIAALSMTDDMQRVATLSNNLANVTTPGYKREVAVSGSFVDQILSPRAEEVSTLAVHLPEPQLVLDTQSGSLRHTGNALDVALEETGFFELMGPQGPLYTRQGEFQLDATGRMVNAGGLPVMGVGGEIILSGNQPRIARDGKVYEADKLVGQLRVVRFADTRVLEKAGSGVYVAKGDGGSESATSKMRQGHLENSNVVTTNEMVRLIETMRHFETNQKLIQSYDEMLERAIRTLGEF